MRFSFAWMGVVCASGGERLGSSSRGMFYSLLLMFGELEKWNNPVYLRVSATREHTAQILNRLIGKSTWGFALWKPGRLQNFVLFLNKRKKVSMHVCVCVSVCVCWYLGFYCICMFQWQGKEKIMKSAARKVILKFIRSHLGHHHVEKLLPYCNT